MVFFTGEGEYLFDWKVSEFVVENYVFFRFVAEEESVSFKLVFLFEVSENGDEWRDPGATSDEDAWLGVLIGLEFFCDENVVARLELMELFGDAGRVIRVLFDDKFEIGVVRGRSEGEGARCIWLSGQGETHSVAGLECEARGFFEDESLGVVR